MSAESLAVSVRGLVKAYGSVPAVRGIDLDIRPGEIFALLGPNGAGNTTTVEILEGYRRRDGGEVSVLGYDPGRESARIKVTRPSLEDVYLLLTAIQFRYVNKTFWRNPASAFFTFAFPLMFLVIFTALLGHYTVRLGARTVDTSTYYVASMACFAAITACFNNIAMAISFQREEGVGGLLIAIKFFSWEPRQG